MRGRCASRTAATDRERELWQDRVGERGEIAIGTVLSRVAQPFPILPLDVESGRKCRTKVLRQIDGAIHQAVQLEIDHTLDQLIGCGRQ